MLRDVTTRLNGCGTPSCADLHELRTNRAVEYGYGDIWVLLGSVKGEDEEQIANAIQTAYSCNYQLHVHLAGGHMQ